MRCGLLDEARLPLETVLLFIAGMTAFIAGILLFPVYAGVLLYYENGLYGLLLLFLRPADRYAREDAVSESFPCRNRCLRLA